MTQGSSFGPTPAGGRPSDVVRDGMRIPKAVLIAAGGLLVFTMVVAGTARITGNNHVILPQTQVVASRDLTFTDQGDGGIEIADAVTGRHVTTVVPTTGGFLRGIMRGLVREHRLNDLAPGSAFRLTRWADGRLSIEDPTTHERFELEAFGPTNEAVFARLLVDVRQPDQAGAASVDAAPGAAGAAAR